jgi:predicted esterase YcpF (UPF0227 family)
MLVYLHGLNSSGASAKATLLRAALAPYPVVAPHYPAHRPAEAVAVLCAFLAGLPDPRPALVGSSMGGFYGQWLARQVPVSHLYMINPALTPWDLFQAHLGVAQTTALGETYHITPALAESTRAFGITRPGTEVPTTLFLDRGDEVIDYRIAEGLYRDHGRLLIWDGGDHAFQHMDEAIAVIRRDLALPD